MMRINEAGVRGVGRLNGWCAAGRPKVSIPTVMSSAPLGRIVSRSACHTDR